MPESNKAALQRSATAPITAKGGARRAIMARRARFIAAALASAGVSSATAACICLSRVEPAPAVIPDATAAPATVVVDPLRPDNAPPDAGALRDASKVDGEGADATTVTEDPRPRPTICLSFDPGE